MQDGQYYAFGDSLSDNGRVLRETGYDPTAVVGPQSFNASGIYQGGRWSNAPNYTEVVPSLIGLPYVPSNDFAVGGAQSVHQDPSPLFSPAFAWGLPDQIDTFTARVGRFASSDVINVWIGYNDLSQIPLTATQAQKDAAVASIVSNTTNAITRLAGLGGRDFVVFDQETYRPDGRTALAQELNAQLPAALQPLSASGLDIQYFDVDSLLNQLRANPIAYGFAADAGTVAFNASLAYAQNGAATGLENQYISPDGVHLTGRVNTIVAQTLAAQLNASEANSPVAPTVQATYQQVLGRAAGVSELRQGVSALELQGQTATGLRAQLASSPEAQAAVNNLYAAQFGQGADAASLSYWTAALTQGTTTLGAIGTVVPFLGGDATRQIFQGTAGNDVFQDAVYAAPYKADLYVGGGGHDVLAMGGTARGTMVTAAPNGDTVLVRADHGDVLRGVAEADYIDGRLVFDASDPAAQVVRLYQAGLGRQPDASGLSYWTDQVRHGASLGQIAQSFLGSAEFGVRFGQGGSNAAFVNAIYNNVLGRTPDASGAAYWTGLLNQGTSRADVLAGISESAENKQATAALVQSGIWDLDQGAAEAARMYGTVFGRLPDASGLGYWAKAIDTGAATLQDMARAFIAGPEFQQSYGSLSNRDFVSAVYRNTLHRPGDPAGVDYWTSQLDTGASRTAAVVGFSESAEHQQLTAANITGTAQGQFGILTA